MTNAFENFVPLLSAPDPNTCKHICFIDSAVTLFQEYLNSETYPVVYSPDTDRESLKSFLLSHFTHIDRISFVFHGPPDNSSFSPKLFINNQSFFISENHVFLQELFTSLSVPRVDFLACNLLQQDEWKDFFATFTNVIVGASLDDTGNMKYGGNWVMENTMENIRDLYFTSSQIVNFASLLASYTYTDAGGNSYPFIFTTSGSTATITGFTNPSSLRPVTIPNILYISTTAYTVTAIGASAFINMTNITRLTLPESVTSIGISAFSGCTNLGTINIPGSVAIIPASMCTGCTSLNSVIISKGVTSIGISAFQNCTKLYRCVLPNGVTFIGNDAFNTCSSLTIITIPGSLTTTMGQRIFLNCTKLTTVYIGHGVYSVGKFGFQGCTSLTSIILPATAVSITPWAFAYTKISRIVWPIANGGIAGEMFRDCTSLTSVVIHKNITGIAANAYAGCTSLAKVFFTGNVIPAYQSTATQLNWFTTTGTSAQIYYLDAASATSTNLATITGTKTAKTPYEMYNLIISAGYSNTYSASAIYNFNSTYAFTQSDIQTAVDAWCSDPIAATATYGHITTWNTVNVTNMSGLFSGKTTFNDDICVWNTTNVTNMDNMFYDASLFNKDISSWTVSNVSSMTNMFANATAFNKDISLWEVPLIASIPSGFTGMTDSKMYPNWGKYNLTLYGSSYITVYQNRLYTDLGVSDLYSPIITTGDVINTSVIGSYTVEYSATAAVTGKSKPSSAIRYISVIADPSPPLTATFPTSTTFLNKGITVTISAFQTSAVSWQSSIDGGRTWTSRLKTTVSFTLPDSTYAMNAIQLMTIDSLGNLSGIVTNSAPFIIDLVAYMAVAPYISLRPTVSAPIVFPALIGSVSLSGGIASAVVSGVVVPGIFTISSAISGSIYSPGIYTDVSATFSPTDTVTYLPISTSIPTITVLKATPYISARPVSASVLFPNKLSSLVIIGGACLITSGGAALPGTFSIHPDLSNSVFVAGTYQDVSAIFTPTSALNYNSVVTTIQTVTITKATNVQLQSLGIPATDLKTVGYTATELLTANFTTAQLKNAAYTPTELKSAGVSTATLYSLFSTPTETKSVTKALVTDLLVSTPKTTVPLSTMIGYTFETFVTSVVALKVSDISVPITVTRSEFALGKTAVYAVMDVSGSYVVLPTYSSSIRVMNIGADRYRVYAANGTTILQDNLLTGSTVALDGLTVVIGSVTATMTPPPSVNFVLSAMNSFIQLSTSSVIPNYSQSFTSDATITLNTGVAASVLQNTFFFRTDTAITTDASFVYYYVDTTQWSNKNTTLSARNGIVTNNSYVTGDTGGKDFLRDLARQLFGTYLGADLFTNEDMVVADINSKFDTVATNIESLLLTIDKASGTFGGISTDSSGNKYLKDDVSTSNISRELLNQLMTVAPARFVDIKTNYGTMFDGFYKMPILAGDSISFKVTISPAVNQMVAVPTASAALTNRIYTVILNVI